ncbi:Uncharacterized protein HZ326_2325 [Fusarium oxysporum f. sp. albedinis]|nr:Uncharacterized protein HZ326_2325 [Fusarium oxysporum f. sp. albedinis]
MRTAITNTLVIMSRDFYQPGSVINTISTRVKLDGQDSSAAAFIKTMDRDYSKLNDSQPITPHFSGHVEDAYKSDF